LADVPLKEIIEPLNAKGDDLKRLADNGNKRIEVLDELRGACLLLMIAFHAFYLFGTRFQFFQQAAARLYETLLPAQPAVAALFILISGYSMRLSENPKLRAALLTAAAVGVSFATIWALPRVGILGMGVWFGILHMLACSKWLFVFGQKLFDKIPSLIGLGLSMFLFFFTASISNGYVGVPYLRLFVLPQEWYHSNVLAFLGIHNSNFYSWDYFPLLPYFFVFLFGAYAGKAVKRDSFPDFCYNKHMKLFGGMGKHSLLVYLLHLPALYGLGLLLQQIANKLAK
jgi:uncharacterized membrane protein